MPAVPPARGAEIRRAYENRGQTRESFAAETGIPAKSLTNITSGGHCSAARAVRIARALGKGWTKEQVFTDPAVDELVAS